MRALALLLFASVALADGLTITTKPNTWLLRDPSTTPITDYGRYDTAEACAKAAPKPGKFRCDSSVQVEAVLSCVGVKAPTIPLVKNADGNWEEPDAFAVEINGKWTTLQNLYVPGSTACWVRGLADPDQWRVNGTNPAAPFMELVTPDMPPLADQPNWDSTDPTWSDADQVKWDNPVSVAARALP